MDTMTPITTTPVEAWLARLELEALEVDRCPDPRCALCAPVPVIAAA